MEPKKKFEMSNYPGEQKFPCAHQPFPNLWKLSQEEVSERFYSVLI